MASAAVINNPSQYFDFIRVGVDEPRWLDVMRLRYEVYCLECRFLAARDYPDGLESDEFDKQSVHFAGVNSESQVIATLRLVRDSRLGFPLERHAGKFFPSFHELPRDRTVELSRLILARRYRRRRNDGRYATGGVGADARAPDEDPHHRAHRRSPYPLILFGLFRGMFEESLNTGLEYWLAAMEPWLQTFLGRFGFAFMPVGHPIEYFGEVVPYAAKISDVVRTVAETKAEVLEVIMGSRQGAPARAG